ncbi:MAG: hypothetical protein HJJLKODD_00835 [Phycisphaerae bacterium]|nr:hypothetical protein [Phycisphaerae bacterium]
MISRADTLTLTILQPALRWQQPMPNLFTLREQFNHLPAAARLVLLPANWAGLPPEDQQAVPWPDQLQFLQNLARKQNCYLVGGTCLMPGVNEESRIVSPILDASGEWLHSYFPGSTFIFTVDGWKVAILWGPELWHYEVLLPLLGQIDLLLLPHITQLLSDVDLLATRHVLQQLLLTRALETGLIVGLSDWAAGRHTPKDIDRSIGSPASTGTIFDRGVLYRRVRDRDASPTAAGPLEPTAITPTGTAPGAGPGIFYTTGSASLIYPAAFPDLNRLQQTLLRGDAGQLTISCRSADL